MNVMIEKLTGLKSYDYHIIMERLLPVMFQGYLDDVVSKVLAKLSYFYRHLCAKEIMVEMMEKLEKEVSVLLCKMENIFPQRSSLACSSVNRQIYTIFVSLINIFIGLNR
jgi:hypothetical protein